MNQHALRIPGLADNFYHLGLVYVELQRDEKAIGAFAKTIKINPENTEALEQAGLALARLEKYEDAIEIFDRCLRQGRESARIQFEKGCAFFALKKYEDAIPSFDRAIELSNHTGALVKKGQALWDSGVMRRHSRSLTGSSHSPGKWNRPFCHGNRAHPVVPVRDAVIALDRALEYEGSNARIHACKGYALYRLTGSRKPLNHLQRR